MAIKAMNSLSAIPIRRPYIDWILDGSKTWEVRSKRTQKIGPVALIQSGSGTVVGTANLSQVIELTPEVARRNARLMGMTPPEAMSCAGQFAWVLEKVVKLKSPVRYSHPPGAVTWVSLDEETTKAVQLESARSRD